MLDDDRPMGEQIDADDDAHINIPPAGDRFFLQLAPLQKATIKVSTQADIVADKGDDRPRKMLVQRRR